MEVGAKRFLLIASGLVVLASSAFAWLGEPYFGLHKFMCDAHAATYDALVRPQPGFPIKPGWCAPGDVRLDLIDGPVKFHNLYRVSCSGKPQPVSATSNVPPSEVRVAVSVICPPRGVA